MPHYIELGNLVPGTLAVANSDADYKVRDIRTKLYKQYPNEEMERYPLTKIVLSGKGRILDRTKCEWGMEGYDNLTGTITGAFSDANMTSAINSAQSAGTVVYLQGIYNELKRFIPLEDIELRVINKTTGVVHSVNLDILSVSLHSSSFGIGKIEARLLENETVGQNTPLTLANDTEHTSYASVISYAAPENSTIPPGRFREPTIQYNYSQIIMQGLSVTGSELADKSLFDEETYARYFRQTMDRFHEQFERMIKFGVRREDTGVTVNYFNTSETVNRWRCGGLKFFIRNNTNNYIQIPKLTTLDGESFAGKSWATHGEWFFQVLMNRLSKKSGSRKKVFVSSTGRLIINELLKSNTNIQVGPFTKDKWGFDVQEIHGMNCKLELHQDAGLSMNPAWEHMMIIVEPDKIEFRPRKGRDLTVIRSKKDVKAAIENGWTWRDGIREGVFIDGTLTFDDLDGMAIVEGLGSDFAT